MRTIIGLGNPGEKYKDNRHNVGHMLVDFVDRNLPSINSHLSMAMRDFNWIKTDIYMNQSGLFVKKCIDKWKLEIENLFVVHDDLDIPFGKFKIQYATGPKVHNGLRSIEDELGTDEFWRIRIGVEGRPTDGLRPSGEAYVLSDFTPEESAQLSDIFIQVARRLDSI